MASKADGGRKAAPRRDSDLFGALERSARAAIPPAAPDKGRDGGAGQRSTPPPPAAAGGKGRTPPAPRPAAEPGRYTEDDIEILEGLEPVRRRPGMYIGGTDEKALHHLFAEVLDNAMDEAVAGHASFIEVELDAEGFLRVTDNGRGIPVGPHPKQPDRSTLEVILCTLHAGGKFDSKAYETSGGLHGVGVSVVNALSERLEVEVARDQTLYRMAFSRGTPLGGLDTLGRVLNRRGTTVRFRPDPTIFKDGARFAPERLFRMARSKAYLFGGVEIRWCCAPVWLAGSEVPERAVFRFPGGLADFLGREIAGKALAVDGIFAGKVGTPGKHGAVEWAMAWLAEEDGSIASYCNTIPTAEGGAHEAGLRVALTRAIKDHAERTGHAKRFKDVTTEDVLSPLAAMLAVSIREPEFVGQTKDRLATVEAGRIVETALRDALDHWLAASKQQAERLMDLIISRTEERLRRRAEKDVARKSATRKLRLPGKLADCTNTGTDDSEIFIVEGDSAGGSAKMARDRASQAVLPLRGKILNVAAAGRDKLSANQQLQDLALALGCGTGNRYNPADLRYGRVIIMTDADVDGAHIASLLITYFYREMPRLIESGRLFLAQPPLFRIQQGAKSFYARDEADRDRILASLPARAKVEVSRFKGLGEMLPAQLRETTMNPASRTLLRITIEPTERAAAGDAVERLMGNRPEARFSFIQERAAFATDLDV